jgi:beta-mannosidase
LKNGDLHYWGVWHGDSAFSSFRNNVGRFVSEYGFQSYPDSATLATQLDPEHLYLGSPMLAARQKSYKTDKPIWTAIDREFAVKPRYLGEFILFSQLAQAEAYRQAIWAHVTSQPHCMGTLFWQLNDVWAGPSWSTVDHTGTWKAAMYEVARSYKPVVLDLELTKGKFTATLWNERTDLKSAMVVTQVFRTDGPRISSDTSTVMLGMGKKPLPSVGQEALLKGGGPDRHVVRVAVLDDRGEVLAERILPFKRMGEMAWEKAEVRLERVGGTERAATYRLSTDRPVPVVKLEASGAEFSDNYFPLLPDTDRTVTVTWPGGMTGKVGLRSWP